MKKKLLWFFTLLPMVVTTVAMQFMPDKIPAHYDMAGNIDRWGSKYEGFIMPSIIIVLTLFWSLFIRHFEKKQRAATDEKEAIEAANNAKIIYYMAIGQSIMFGIMGYFSTYTGFLEAKNNMSQSSVDKYLFINIFMSIFFIVIGNILPKSKRNSVVGLRTKASMVNDKVWAMSNRFAGKSLVISGILTIIETLFIGGVASTFIMVGILVVDGIISAVYAQIAVDKYGKENKMDIG